jgi:hypothetical protein
VSLAVEGCAGVSEKPETPRQIAVAASSSPASTQAAPWFEDVRVIDLTGDGVPDTARLATLGQTVDSLEIVFTIQSSGMTVYRNSWERAYALSGADEEGGGAPRSDSALRAQLQAFLGRLEVKPLDRRELQQPWSGKTDDCSEDFLNCIALELLNDSTRTAGFKAGRSLVPLFDTAAVYGIVADMLSNSVPVVTYSYGSESTARIAWSPVKHRFFTLWECC